MGQHHHIFPLFGRVSSGLVGGVRSWQGCFIRHLGDYGRAGNGSGTVRCVEYRE